MRVARVVRETADAVTLWLEDPTGARITFLPGQFFTLLFSIYGDEHRRAYSACSSARQSSSVCLTVKRVKDGVVSNHVNDVVRAGDVVHVLGPSGAFTITPDETAERRLVLLGGGSGITPLMSLARTVLAVEPHAHVALVIGNRGTLDIIFRDALAELVAAHSPRFTVRHVLSQPPASWDGGVGMLDRETILSELLRTALADDPRAEFFVCGPAPMMAAAREALGTRGVPASQIHEERFLSPHLRAAAAAKLQGKRIVAASLVVRAGGKEHSLGAPSGRTVLEMGLAAGLPMPFSCAMGGCGACKVKVVSGTLEMEEPNCLTSDERARGYALACIGCPTSDTVVELPR